MNHTNKTAAHIMGSYLIRTQNWIHSQIYHQKDWNSIVLCRRTQNPESFTLPGPICSLDKLNPIKYYSNYFIKKVSGYFPYYNKVIEQYNPLLLHAHFGQSGYDFLVLAKIVNLPLITTFYGYDLSKLPKDDPLWIKRYQILFKQGTIFLVEGSFMRQKLIELGCPTEKIVIHKLGVDLNNLQFKAREPDPSGMIRILASGRFTEKKGLRYALEAFACLCEQSENIQLTIVGDARDKEDDQLIKKQLNDLVAKYKIENKVNFLGLLSYPDLIVQYYLHHIFISPSIQAKNGDNEGGAPVSIIEASATGMPVISTIHCDIPEVIIDQESGYLVPERDIDALVLKLRALLSHPESWSHLGKRGRQHIEENYNIEIQSAQLCDIYNDILKIERLN